MEEAFNGEIKRIIKI